MDKINRKLKSDRVRLPQYDMKGINEHHDITHEEYHNQPSADYEILHESDDENGQENEEEERVSDNIKFEAIFLDEDPPEVEEIRNWAIECKIEHVHLTELLLILRRRLLPMLPKTSSLFLGREVVPKRQNKDTEIESRKKRKDNAYTSIHTNESHEINKQESDLFSTTNSEMNSLTREEEQEDTDITESIQNCTSSLVENLRQTENFQEFIDILINGIHNAVQIAHVPLINSIKRLESRLQQYENQNSKKCLDSVSFTEEHGFNLPLRTIEELSTLENILQEQEVRHEFYEMLNNIYSSGDSITKNLTHILQSILTQELALQFTPARKIEHKFVFRERLIYKYLFSFFNDKIKTTSGQTNFDGKIFFSAIKAVLPNAKDWYNARKLKIDKN